MKVNLSKLMALLVLTALLLSACAPAATQPAPAAEEPTVEEPAEAEPTAVEPAEEESAEPTAQPAAEEPAAGPIVITDALGREVTLEQTPQRIVVAGKAAFMIIDALYAFPEAKERVVALGNAQQGPRGFIPLIEPRYNEITILENEVGAEQVAAERPDLVILKTIVKEDLGDPLESIGIPVVYVNFETPEQYTNDLQILGEALQNTARAQELIDYYAAQQDEIVAATAGLADEQKPRVLLLYYNDRDGEVAFNVPPLSYIQSTLIQQAGGLPVWQDIELGKGWTKVGFEQIAAWDPDQVYLVAYTRDADQVVAELQADPQWQALRAAQEGQLYPVPNDFYSWDQPDTRWALGLRWLASKIQPELFPQIDTVAEARQFYQFAYGLDEAAFDSQVLPLLTELEAVND